MEVKNSHIVWVVFILTFTLLVGFYILNWRLFLFILGYFLSVMISVGLTGILVLIFNSDLITKFNNWLDKK